MRQKRLKIIGLFGMLVILITFIVITNVKYADQMASKQLMMNEVYEANGYSIRYDKYEIVDRADMKDYCKNIEEFDAYEKALGSLSKLALVYATVTVTDVDQMAQEWWVSCRLEADNAWTNSISPYMLGNIAGTNMNKKNYESGKEYQVIFPYCINEVQVTEGQLKDIDHWKFRMIWSVNPIVYMNLY